MRKRWFWIAPLAIVAITLFVFVGGEVVMHLRTRSLVPGTSTAAASSTL